MSSRALRRLQKQKFEDELAAANENFEEETQTSAPQKNLFDLVSICFFLFITIHAILVINIYIYLIKH